ncbi:MAG: hypothetical protein WEA56_07615 [Balneolaceae bacterium]
MQSSESSTSVFLFSKSGETETMSDDVGSDTFGTVYVLTDFSDDIRVIIDPSSEIITAAEEKFTANFKGYSSENFLEIKLSDKIQSLSSIQKNWDSYGAPPPSQGVVRKSETILSKLISYNLIPEDILPSVEGGISFIFTSEDKYATIEVHNDGDIIVGLSNLDVWEINDEKDIQKSKEKISEFFG